VLAEKVGTLGLHGRLNWTWYVPYHLFKPTCNTALLHLRILSRAVSVKGIDKALIQEPWYREGRIRGLNIPRYTLFSASGIDLGLVSLRGTRLLGCCQDSLPGT